MRRLAHHDPRVDKLVRYWLTPVCGGYMPDVGFRQFASRMGHDPDSITAVRYRGHGCPGPTRIEHEDGSAAELHYLDVWGDDDSQWVLSFRCKVCADGIGEAADIAAADNWDGGAPTREGSETDPGSNAMIVRTEAGARLVAAAIGSGRLVEETPLTIADLGRMQPHHVRRKLSGLARARGLAAAGSGPRGLGDLGDRTHYTRLAKDRADRVGKPRDVRLVSEVHTGGIPMVARAVCPPQACFGEATLQYQCGVQPTA